mmetsp:Transcript_51479/g.122423  ORF Transcript_51479/g.122423 Transcript_51479/m.122423 type:complete len:285 (-) Transcript_51479:282-1136(-)
MHRAIPVGSKICHQRDQERLNSLHQRRLQEIRPQVDTRPPSVCQLDHVRNKLKREQLLEERYYQIDRDNRILLQKMSDIMRGPGYSSIRGRSGPPSLNKDSRKMELMRITQENQNILKRIQRAQPMYNHVEWEDSYRASSGYMRNLCEYPPALTAGKGGWKPKAIQDGKARSEDYSKASNYQYELADPGEMRYVLKEGKKIGSGYYLVEMATDGRTLAISAYHGDSKRTLELLVNERNHRALYRDCNGDYNAIANQLTIDGDQLKLPISSGGMESNTSVSGGSG